MHNLVTSTCSKDFAGIRTKTCMGDKTHIKT